MRYRQRLRKEFYAIMKGVFLTLYFSVSPTKADCIKKESCLYVHSPPRTHNENKNFNKSIIALTIAILFSAQAESRALKEENISYDKRGDGIFVIDLDDRTTPDLNSIIVNQIEFNEMGESDPYTRPGNGAVRLDHFTQTGTPIDRISVSNIKENNGFDIVYFGIKSLGSSFDAKEIFVNDIDTTNTVSPFGSAIGFHFQDSTFGFEKITISKIQSAYTSAGLLINNASFIGNKETSSISVSEISAGTALGVDVLNGQDFSGNVLSVSQIHATAPASEQLVIGGDAHGINIDGKVDFQEIQVSDVKSASYQAYGFNISGNAIFQNNLLKIDEVIGATSFGLTINADSKQSDTPDISTNRVEITNIGGTSEESSSNSKESIGIRMTGNSWEGQSVTVDGIWSSSDGSSIGIQQTSERVQSPSSLNLEIVSIGNVSGGQAFGLVNSADQEFRGNDPTTWEPIYIPTKASFLSKQLDISGISGDVRAFGVHNASYANLDLGKLTIKDIQANFSVGFNAEAKSVARIGYADINPAGWDGYQGGYDENGIADNEESLPLTTFAVRAVSGAEVNFVGETHIYGTIVAGKTAEPNDVTNDDDDKKPIVGEGQGGIIRIGGQQNSVTIYGDVYAGNGGTVELTLDSTSLLEGQIDDYHELGTVQNGVVFRNSAFVNSIGAEVPVTASGSATINLNGGTWLARGQSFVKNVTFGTLGGRIDLTKNTNSSVSIENLSGQGHFAMTLGAYADGTDAIETDMLYIQNVLGADSFFTIEAYLADGVTAEDLVGLRFATVGSVESGHSSNLFKVVQVTDQGFNNLNLQVATEDFRQDDVDNARFNGTDDGKDTYKPGEDAVEAIFGDNHTRTNEPVEEGAQNYYIESVQEGSTISDAGQAVIATARGLYYNAVEIDRFSQRYGDRRYDETNNSLWARVRHDRWGSDAGVGDFESKNTTYQVGYDFTRFVENGKMIYGAAFDFMDGDTDYDSISGTGETKRYAISAYATYIRDNGSYLDMIGKVGRLSNEYAVKLDSGTEVSADYMNWMSAVSVEVGHQFSRDTSRWFVEPQVQAQYVFVSDNDYSNGQTKIEQDAIHSFITRAGFRVGRWLDEEKNAHFYVKADVLHEWAGQQDIHVTDKTTVAGGETFEINNHGTWFDVGLGFQAPLGKSFYAYGDAEYRFGNDLDQTWTFNFGGKFVF